MSGAIWNWTTTLADDPYWANATPRQRAMRERIARGEQQREFTRHEADQLLWEPAPGRLPYAGADEDTEE